MKTNKLLALLLSLALLASLFGCTPAATPTAAPAAPAKPAATEAPAAPAANAIKVALILPGRADDVSWNQASYEGVQWAIKNTNVPIELKVVEQVYDPVDIEPALRDYAQQGYNLVIGHGFQFQEPIIKVATEFPNVNFAIGTGYKLAPNVGVYDVKLEEGGYLMGILAASLSQSNIIGITGGVDVSEIHRGHAAYFLGAQSVKKDIKVLNNFVGDFNDLAGAKEAALSQVGAGADVLWQSGDGVGLAVLEGCKEKGKLCMGNVATQNSIAPDNVIASFVYHWGAVYKQMFEEVAAKSFGNKKYWIELANNGVSVIYNDALKSKITPETMKLIEDAMKGLANGSINLGDLDAMKLEE